MYVLTMYRAGLFTVMWMVGQTNLFAMRIDMNIICYEGMKQSLDFA